MLYFAGLHLPKLFLLLYTTLHSLTSQVLLSMPGTKTQAWIVRAAGDPFSVEDIVLDDPLEDEVLVEMVASGICRN